MKSLLLDANCVIELNEIGRWHKFLNANRVFIPTIIANESVYYEAKGEEIPIDLAKNAEDEQLTLIETENIEEINVREKVKSVFPLGELDKGELQAIAILLRENRKEMHFCTADQSAIRVCSLLGLGNCCISLESALTSCRMKTRVKRHFSKKFMKEWRQKGETERIQHKNWTKE